jgi:hypothetical protein
VESSKLSFASLIQGGAGESSNVSIALSHAMKIDAILRQTGIKLYFIPNFDYFLHIE